MPEQSIYHNVTISRRRRESFLYRPFETAMAATTIFLLGTPRPYIKKKSPRIYLSLDDGWCASGDHTMGALDTSAKSIIMSDEQARNFFPRGRT